MKILLSWLREFVDVPDTAEAIAARMGVRGFAVEGIEQVGDDAVLDFEITANRPDCMSVAGMAREVATAYGLSMRDSGLGPRDSNNGSSESRIPDPESRQIAIAIDAPELCGRYAGRVADVSVAPSPAWMQARLKAAGVRPISNVVDVTAYVMLELGQPMHAFDYAKLGGAQIRVRTARAGERLKTLDGQTRELTPEMLVIADAERPVAIAGVMGGADSEVTGTTRVTLLESAYFNPLSVRRTSKKLGLKTEASMRFERGVDPLVAGAALARACGLLEQISAGRAGGEAVDRHPSPAQPRQLPLRRAKVAGLLGADIPAADVRRILESLDFVLADAGDGWQVTVPTRRVDIVREVDLIEEVARHYGFDRIPSRFPALASPPPPPDPRITQARQLRALMTGAGFSEALTFGFIGQPAAAPFAAEGDLVPIANPLSENFAVLRPSALPGLIDAVAHNRRREQQDVRLFEVGNRFLARSGERRALACAWAGTIGGDHWSAAARPVDFFDIKGIVERICDGVGVAVRTEPHAEPWLAPGRAAAIVMDDSSKRTGIGTLGQLAAEVAEQHGIPAGDVVYVAEIDLDAVDALKAGGVPRVQPLPRYPSVTRDISLLVDDTLPAAVIRGTISAAAPETLVRVREFDRYQGKGIPEGKVSLSLRLTFRSPERTLTDAEVQSAMDGVVAALREKHGAVQR